MKTLTRWAGSMLAVGLLAGGLSTASAATTEQPGYTVEEIGTLGGNATFALDINDRGQVTGNSRTGTTTLPLLAFVSSGGEMTELGTLPGSNAFSRGYAINNAGVVVGESDNNRSRAFRWADGVMTEVGHLGAGTAVAHGINNSEQIVGASSNGTASRPFVSWRGTIQDLGTLAGGTDTPGRAWDVNDRGDIVGVSRVQGTLSQATLWPGPNRGRTAAPVALGSLGDGARFSEAVAVNNRGWAVGRSTVTGSTERAFLWRSGEGMVDLGSLGLNHSRALDVNNRGQVVGYASSLAGAPTFGTAAAFIWEDGVLTDLNELIPQGSGWELLAAEGINSSGMITGYGRLDGEIRSFVLTPTDG